MEYWVGQGETEPMLFHGLVLPMMAANGVGTKDAANPLHDWASSVWNCQEEGAM